MNMISTLYLDYSTQISSTQSQQHSSIPIAAGSSSEGQPKDDSLSADLVMWRDSMGLQNVGPKLIIKLNRLPHVQDGDPIPDYFGENDEIDDAKLPTRTRSPLLTRCHS